MSVERSASAPVPNWTDTNRCPFCEAPLADPGAGFVRHLADNPDCERGWRRWRDRAPDDVGGGWPG